MNRYLLPEGERRVNKEDLVRAIPTTKSFKTSQSQQQICPLQLPVPSFHMPIREPWNITQGWNVPTHLTDEKLRLGDTEGSSQWTKELERALEPRI